MADFLCAERASVALCDAFCIYSVRLMFSPIIYLGRPLAVDLPLCYSTGFSYFTANVFTLGGDLTNLVKGPAMFDMKIGFGMSPRDLRVTAYSERTGVYLALCDLTLLRGCESSLIDSESSISSRTESSLA